ncbi:MAG: hypothetical protein JRI35_09065 [Deltaproteobacteria bacterium]|nr:hypothetical protein [Deltaproteobacteria bacterium]
MNQLHPALKRLPFSGFQSSLIADRRGGAIRPAAQNPGTKFVFISFQSGVKDFFKRDAWLSLMK